MTDWYGTNGNVIETTGNPNGEPPVEGVEHFDLIGLLWLFAMIAIIKYVSERRR